MELTISQVITGDQIREVVVYFQYVTSKTSSSQLLVHS